MGFRFRADIYIYIMRIVLNKLKIKGKKKKRQTRSHTRRIKRHTQHGMMPNTIKPFDGLCMCCVYVYDINTREPNGNGAIVSGWPFCVFYHAVLVYHIYANDPNTRVHLDLFVHITILRTTKNMNITNVADLKMINYAHKHNNKYAKAEQMLCVVCIWHDLKE